MLWHSEIFFLLRLEDEIKKKWTYHGEVLPFFFTEKWVPDFNQSLLQRTEAEVRLSQFQGVLSKQPKTLPWPFPVWFHLTTVTVTSLLHILTCSQASNQNILSTLVWSSALSYLKETLPLGILSKVGLMHPDINIISKCYDHFNVFFFSFPRLSGWDEFQHFLEKHTEITKEKVHNPNKSFEHSDDLFLTR